jgi:hypothetical protein
VPAQVESLRGFGAPNRESLAQLVWAFFEYWAWRHNYSHDVVCVRLGTCLHKDDKDWTRRIGNERHLVRWAARWAAAAWLLPGTCARCGSWHMYRLQPHLPALLPWPACCPHTHPRRCALTHPSLLLQVCIEDPFELSHDLGRTVDRQTRAVLHKEFTRAATLLRDAHDPLDMLFASYKVGQRG